MIRTKSTAHSLAAGLLLALTTTLSAQTPESIISGAGGDRFGYRITSGDLNGDQRTDVAVAAPHPSGGNKVYVFFGLNSFPKNPELDTQNADAIICGPAGSETGWDVTVGDVLGSRDLDLIVAAPVFGGNDGAVHVFAGPLHARTYDTTTDATLTIAGHTRGYVGWSVAAGDFDGDGKDELCMGAPSSGIGDIGEAYLLDVDGPTPPTDTSNATKFIGVGLTGASMANGGDINNDGYEDFLLGSYGSILTTGFGWGGSVHVVYGRPTFRSRYELRNSAWTQIANINAEFEGANLGYDIAATGDVNADGYDDFLIGAPAHRGPYKERTGSAYLILGSPDLFGVPQISGEHKVSTVADIIFLGTAPNDRTGLSVDAAGFAGTTYSRTPGSFAGFPNHGPVLLIGTGIDRAYGYAYPVPRYLKKLKIGRVQGIKRRQLVVQLGAAAIGHTTFQGPAGSAFGMEVHGPGDLNGDRIGEILFGATYQLDFTHSPGNGQVHVFRGR